MILKGHSLFKKPPGPHPRKPAAPLPTTTYHPRHSDAGLREKEHLRLLALLGERGVHGLLYAGDRSHEHGPHVFIPERTDHPDLGAVQDGGDTSGLLYAQPVLLPGRLFERPGG